MADTFPTCQFGFFEMEADIERVTISGGTSLANVEDMISTDGGGRVFCEFADAELVDREKVLAWRAIKTMLDEGVTEIVVPFCDPRHQPVNTPIEGVPHSDGSPFGDDSLYASGGGNGEVAAPAALRATSLTFTGTTEKPLIGGEWFSIQHPNKSHRAYRIGRIAGSTLTFRPPLREAITAGEVINFRNPLCLMRVEGRPGNRLQLGRITPAAIRFVEAP